MPERHISSSSTLALKHTDSFDVKASSSPPTESISRAICSALRLDVPLNTMCSMKWAMPFFAAGSSARARVEPQPHGHRSHMRHRFNQDFQAVRERLPHYARDVRIKCSHRWRKARGNILNHRIATRVTLHAAPNSGTLPARLPRGRASTRRHRSVSPSATRSRGGA